MIHSNFLEANHGKFQFIVFGGKESLIKKWSIAFTFNTKKSKP